MQLYVLVLLLLVKQISSTSDNDDLLLSTFKFEKINTYYLQFKQELANKYDLKKFYSNLLHLNSDCENLVRTSNVLSNKEMNEFIDSALMLIHKKFHFKSSLDEFLAQFKKNDAEFVLHQNVIDEDLIKSHDWKFKTQEIVENEFKSEHVDNVEFTGQKLRRNMERVKKGQHIINGMDGVNDEINLGHNVFFFDQDLDE